jgi:RNA-directed DNA polymerase
LKYAIRSLAAFHPRLGSWDGPIFKSTTSFFSYANQAHRLLGLNGGTGDLLYFFTKQKYKKDIEGFKHRPLKHPVIILIDNDDGAKSIFSTIKENYKIQIDFSSADPFFYITENLYLVKTPERGQTGASCIEDCFEAILLATELDGKKFNQNTNIDPDKEYGKFVFAEKVVRPNVSTINFSGFSPLLQRLIAAIDDYSLKVV